MSSRRKRGISTASKTCGATCRASRSKPPRASRRTRYPAGVLPDLTTNQKGAIAETAIVKEATRLGIEVCRPVAEGGRFDLIFLIGDRLFRVQCKWAPRQGDVVLIRCYS